MYKLYKGNFNGMDYIVKTNDDGSTTSFTYSEINTDYQEYLKWLEEGNTPLPAEENN
jgi:hypothetical protein